MRYCRYIIVVLLAGFCVESFGQGLRFGNHREVDPPEDAALRIGPFYSTIEFSQSAGYRYVTSSGSGTDYLYDTGRGVIKKDGSEFPFVTRLDLKNYLIISRNADLDISFAVSYAYFPMDTQENELNIHIVDEGLYGNLSAELIFTPFIKSKFYDNITFKTDYLDTRGIIDSYGGDRYEYFQNVFGVDTDWLMAKNMNMGLSLLRKDLVPRDDDFYDQELVEYEEKFLYEYSIYSGLVIGAVATYSQTDFDDPDRQDRGIDDYSAFLTFGEEKGAAISLTSVSVLTLRAGYSQGYKWSFSQTNDTDTARITGEVSLHTQLRQNLSHELKYLRILRGGFKSAFEEVDTYSYRLEWKAGAASAEFYTELSEVVPSEEGENEYRNWASGVDAVYPIVSYIKLLLSSVYTMRMNEKGVADSDEEWLNDYNTWSTRMGTSFSLTKNIDFTTYVQHVDRTSDSETLEYERDTFAATFTFKHKF